jgi:hypothetical protein
MFTFRVTMHPGAGAKAPDRFAEASWHDLPVTREEAGEARALAQRLAKDYRNVRVYRQGMPEPVFEILRSPVEVW